MNVVLTAPRPRADRKLNAALRHLAAIDPDLARARAVAGALPDRSRAPGLETLVRIVMDQQLSVASAAAIWARLLAAAQPFTPDRLLVLSDAELKLCGVSRPKMIYCRAIAEAVAAGRLDQMGRAHV